MEAAKLVAHDVFFNAIGKLDVTLYTDERYPYKTIFKTRRGDMVGYIQDLDYGGLVIPTHYLL